MEQKENGVKKQVSLFFKKTMVDELHNAAMRGDLVRISEVTDVWLLNDKLETVMHTAARCGQSAVLAYLLKNYPLMGTQRNINGETVLHCAVSERQTHIVLQLMTFAPEWVDMVDNNANTPFQWSIMIQYLEAVLIMVTQKPKIVNQLNLDQKTVLHIAAEKNNTTMVQSLLVMCPVGLLVTQDQYGNTPLHIAARCGLVEIVKLFVQADPSALVIATEEGDTPALSAAFMQHYESLRYLIKTHPSVIEQTNLQTGSNLLHFVPNVKTARELIDLKPKLINGVMTDGSSVLHSVICLDDGEDSYEDDDSENSGEDINKGTKCINFILKSKPSLLMHRDNENRTPFNLATENKNSKIINAILQFKPDLIDTDSKDNTVLHVAVEHSNYATIATVFANRIANLYCANINGKTPLCLAVEKHDRPAVQLFQSHVTVEMAVAVRDECFKNCGIDLQALCLQQCETLQQFLLPPLTHIIFEFCGIVAPKTIVSKKRSMVNFICNLLAKRAKKQIPR